MAATLPAPRRGEVWLARLDKVRPVVVLTRDPFGRVLRSVIAAPVTTTIRNISTEVVLGASDGLRTRSVASVDNLQLVSRDRLVRRIGRVTAPSMTAICRAVAIATGCGAR
jgi:mRNA interferase MazF